MIDSQRAMLELAHQEMDELRRAWDLQELPKGAI
jgi:hypothetical protein